MYIGLHVRHPALLSDFSETWIFSTDFRKILNCGISWNSVQWECSLCVRTDGWMDGQTDMKKLIVFFCNFAIVPIRSHARRGTACCKTARTLKSASWNEMDQAYRQIQRHRKVTVRFLGWWSRKADVTIQVRRLALCNTVCGFFVAPLYPGWQFMYHFEFSWDNVKYTDHLLDQDRYGRIILKRSIKK